MQILPKNTNYPILSSVFAATVASGLTITVLLAALRNRKKKDESQNSETIQVFTPTVERTNRHRSETQCQDDCVLESNPILTFETQRSGAHINHDLLSKSGVLHPVQAVSEVVVPKDSSWLEKPSKYLTTTDSLLSPNFRSGKIIIVMVGLPGRGKTLVSRKLSRYLRWISYKTRVFFLSCYRREKVGEKVNADFFDEQNDESRQQRMEVVKSAIEDIHRYLDGTGEVAILDGTNLTRERREFIVKTLRQNCKFQILFLESIVSDEDLLRSIYDHVREYGPDFVEDSDFQRRMELSMKCYQPVQNDEGSYVKIINAGQEIKLHEINGFLPSKIASFVMNMQLVPRPIFFTRHGQSLYNIHDRIGGDSGLSPAGEEYSKMLTVFVKSMFDVKNLTIWTSTMVRTRQTAKDIPCNRLVEWRALREIEVGICDGMTYNEVKEKYPEEYEARKKDKLRYRYPRGESYLDIIHRLEPVIFEIERQTDPVLIIAHQAVLRCLYSYFLDLPAEEIPYLSVPLHTVIRLIPYPSGCQEQRFQLASTAGDDH